MNAKYRHPHEHSNNGQINRHEATRAYCGHPPGNGRTNPQVREPIVDSNLSRFPWPKPDPETVAQSQRVRNAIDRQRVVQASTAHLDAEGDRILRKTLGRPLAERLQHLLADNVLNFNPCPPIRDSVSLRWKFEAHICRGDPITLYYPLFAKIGNRAKLMYNDGPTAGEEVCIRHFLNIDHWVRTLYEPGVRIIALCDARLYNLWLLNPEPVVSFYMRRLWKMVKEIDARGVIELIDYADLLSERHQAFLTHYADAQQRMRNDLSESCPGVNLATVFEALRASICTGHMGMTYDDHRRTFSHDRDRDCTHHRRLDDLAREALIEMMSTRHACAAIEPKLVDALWPDAIRATCHIARDPERPVVGLRVYPDYKRTSRHLPYHGAPIIYHDGQRMKMVVHPEVRLRALPGLVRVTNEDDETYYYSGLEAGIRGDEQGLLAEETKAG